jgi:hypothetical protein
MSSGFDNIWDALENDVKDSNKNKSKENNIEIFEKEDKGAEFLNIRLKKKIDGLFCVGKKRYVINGFPKLTILKNSRKFGRQVQISICSSKNDNIRVEDRNDSVWNTIEINFPEEDWKEIYQQLKGIYENF